MAKQVVKRSPAFLRREAIKRRQRKKSHRDESSAKPNWVDKLKRSYNPDADKMKTPKNAAWAKKKKAAGSDSEMDDDLGSVSDVGEGMEVESEIDEEKVTRLNEVQPLDTQLFVRGLPSDADVEHLKTVFGRFGHSVRRVLPVINSMTKRASGAAFVHFETAKGADAVLNHAIANAREMTADEKNNDLDATAGLSHHQAKKLLFKLKQDRFTSKEPFMTILGTRVTVMRPLSRDETQDMTSGGKDKKAKRTPTGADDPRNLYLLREGVIEPDTPAAEGLNPRFLASLQRDYETRKHQLRNVNLFVSRTRLSVRNIPRHVDTKQLRALFLDQVRALIKQRPELKDKKSWGKFGPIKNVKVLVDSTGASKGYGFVEFVRHEYALYTLRLLNNNPTTFGPNSRLVVAFAVENVNALQKMERMKLLRKQREEQRKRGGFEDDDDDDSKKQSAVRRLIDKADDAAVSKPSGAPAKAAASINASAKTAVKRAETKKTPRSLNTRKSAARKRVNNERVNRK